MSNHISVNIPVESYIKKYLSGHAFLKRPFRLTSTDPIGILLMHLLRPGPRKGRPVKIKHGISVQKLMNKKLLKKLENGEHVKTSELLNVNLAGYTNRCSFHLPKESEFSFNKFVDGLMRLELFTYVSNNESNNVAVDTLINNFMAKYDFNEEDISFETLKKSYYRYKKNVESVD